MSSPSVVVCREIFDENSQPSAEEISEYACQLGIDPDSESHLLPLARDGLMQALPAPWKAYFDEKLQAHYYYNEDTKKTQWEHPLDHIYRELVKKARDASMQDDTCASVQELLTSEEYTKNLERAETKVESDDEDLTIDSEQQPSDRNQTVRKLAPLGKPPISRIDKKLIDMRISPLRRATEGPKPLVRNASDKDILHRTFERPKTLFKQQSEIIDLKMHVQSPEEENFAPLITANKYDKGLPFSGKGNMFLKISRSNLPSPDTDKSLPLDSVTKSEKTSESIQRRIDSMLTGKTKQASSFEDDKKSVRFKLENLPDPTISPGSNSSSEQNEAHSIISAVASTIPSPVPNPLSPITQISSIAHTQNPILSPLVGRPPLPPRFLDSPRELKTLPGDTLDDRTSPRRRLVKPPPGDYIKPDLFQKSFSKISDIVRRAGEPAVTLTEPVEKENRPRSPMIPPQNKISINLMESIESETSIDSPDREFANLDLNDLDTSNENKDDNNEDKIDNTDDTKVTDAKPKDIPIPQIKVPKLNLITKHSDSDESKNRDDEKSTGRSNSIELPRDPKQFKLSPTPSLGSERSPKLEFIKNWSSPLSTFKPLKSVSPLKSDSASSLGKSLTSPRLDGVILSQGKSSSDNVVVVYQFETQDETPKPKSPLIPDMGARELIERTKTDERRRLELSMQKELEIIRVEWTAKERKMRAELQEEIQEAEEKFLREKRMRLNEQAERHRREIEEAIATTERKHQQGLSDKLKELEEKYNNDVEAAENQHKKNMNKLREDLNRQLNEMREELEIDNERAISELRSQLSAALSRERARLADDNRAALDALRAEHAARVSDLRHDYRAEVERLRAQQACHLEELRSRRPVIEQDRALADKYRCLKEKYARLKHDFKISIERRNKRREMSMTTGSETEKSNSHKANQSLERCKELNETSVSVVIEAEPKRTNNNLTVKSNDNETSYSDNAPKSLDNNNEDWKRRDNTLQSDSSHGRERRRTAVAFREPPRRHRHRGEGTTTDCQDSSDATTADEKPKDAINGHGRRRCFTRLKSASTSRLNYSPKRGEGWSSPLESLRQQLRKLDDLEDQFPDLACQPAYSLRYPFAELGPVAKADTPELEFVRHRALVEREGMRRARAVLKRRRAALRESRASLSPHRAPSEASTSDASSDSSRAAAGGAVLRSLRALHADVRDIWRALDARRAATASPETSSCNMPTTSHTRLTMSAPEPVTAENDSVAERAKGLRAWLQTAP
ncbi:uncharacterized protein LOC121734646 isoform X2 [Aricia agestis]|uniref:uncharacterized protein LOC121734646 isoform X2 n=1 Tax=Aricia agestis TaxID=91739 RepID=UPI001C2072F9|nr:uncharacterized protein LOC121734646 isoform X2 [Aricia agestis]